MDDDKSGSEHSVISPDRKIMVNYIFNNFLLWNWLVGPVQKDLANTDKARKRLGNRFVVDVRKLCVSKMIMFQTCYNGV